MSERKPRWWLRVLTVVLVLAGLAGAAEFALRLFIPGIVEGVVRGQLGLTNDHPVDVDLGGSALLSATRGGIGNVTIDVPGVPVLDGVETDAVLKAELIPFNPLVGELTNARVTLTVPKDQLDPVVSLVTNGVAETGEVSDGVLAVGRSIELFGQQVALTAKLGVEVKDGAVEVEPLGVNAAGFELSSEQLAATTGSLLEPILKPQTLCVRDQIPAGVTLTDVTFSSTGSVVIDADLAPGVVSNPKLRAPGSCG